LEGLKKKTERKEKKMTRSGKQRGKTFLDKFFGEGKGGKSGRKQKSKGLGVPVGVE